MKKKLLALVLVLALVVSLAVALAACDPKDEGGTGETTISFSPIEKSKIKFGLICLHGEESTYDKNFIDAARQAVAALGLDVNTQLVIKTNIPEDAACYEAAADLVDQGCNVIFADSFGHESYMLQAAKEFPNVRFAHATGTTAHTELQGNFYNAFASVYQARYLAGVAAGMKLAEMYGNGDGKAVTAENAKIGYVGAFPYAEVVSGYTSFFLGVRSIVPAATMTVRYTSSWYDPEAEENTAKMLIESDGCKLISQHADSMGAPDACKAAGIPNVTYNISTKDSCGDSYLVGSKINWAVYYAYIINCVRNNAEIAADWTGTLANDAVQILEFGNTVSEAAKAAVEEAKAALKAGTLEVFDLDTFTITIDKTNSDPTKWKNGNALVEGMAADAKTGNGKLVSYMADVHTDAAFTGDTQVVHDGYFAESEYRSAPYFDLRINGITEK